MFECNVESEWESGVRCGKGMAGWGQVMQGPGAQNKELGFHFSIERKPRRGLKQGSRMIIYVCGLVSGSTEPG